MMSYGLATRTMPQWVIEVMMVGFGVGMGLVMTPATNAIMSAVPEEKAGAGAAVNNTVRQVAAALGVAMLGSLLAVAFRSHLGSDAPAQLGRQTRPAGRASSRRCPPVRRRSTYVKQDAVSPSAARWSTSARRRRALQQRAKSPAAADLTPAQIAQQRAQAQQAIGGFVDEC